MNIEKTENTKQILGNVESHKSFEKCKMFIIQLSIFE